MEDGDDALAQAWPWLESAVGLRGADCARGTSHAAAR